MILLTKEEFKKCFQVISDQNKKQETFIEALETLSPGTYCDCFLYDVYEGEYVYLIKKLMNDEYDDIDYFLYELPDILKYATEEDKLSNRIPPYRDLDSLYDYLVEQDKKLTEKKTEV